MPDTVTIELSENLCVQAVPYCADANTIGLAAAPDRVVLRVSAYEQMFRSQVASWSPATQFNEYANAWATNVDHEFWHIVQWRVWTGRPVGRASIRLSAILTPTRFPRYRIHERNGRRP